MQSDELAKDHTGTINKTVKSVLEGKHPSETIPSCAMLETYEETPIFIPVNITEEAVESVVRKFSGSSIPRDMDSKALQGWLLKFGEESTILCTRIENFVDWLANGSPPWSAYCAFMSGRMIAFHTHPGICLVGIRETVWSLFAKIVLKVTGSVATMTRQDDQLCAGLKAVLYGAIHGVQAL